MNINYNPINSSFQLNCHYIVFFRLRLKVFKTLVFFIDSGRLFHREGPMYERPLWFMLIFKKRNLELGKVTPWFYSTLMSILINFIQITRTGIVDKIKSYSIYALMHPFIYRQLVKLNIWFLLSNFKQKRMHLFCSIYIF